MTIEITPSLANTLLPNRPADSHKGVFGHLFIVAGSRAYSGAAVMTAHAAERSGVGLVTLGIPASLSDCVSARLVETMLFPLPYTEQQSFARDALFSAVEFAADKQAVVIGPGLSQEPETRDFAVAFIRQCAAPMVIDADALNALSTIPKTLAETGHPCILTPHPGEMARLTGRSTEEIQSDRIAAATGLARESGCVVVLKGARTVVAAAGGEAYVNTTGNAGLAKGGTGDVLSGLMGGLLAQGMTPCNAAVLGVFLHGLAGDLAAQRLTQPAMTAMDVIAALPDAWRVLEWRE